jgi:hypothetical protein
MKVSLALALLALSVSAFGQSTGANPGAAATSSSATPAQPQTGFTMVNGQLYEYRNGQLQPVTGDLVLRISPNGTVTGFDGRAYTIPVGVVLSIEARVAPATALPPLAALPAATPAPVETPTVNSTTIYTGPAVDAVYFGTTTVVPVPTTVVIPGTVTLPPLAPVPPFLTGARTATPAPASGRPVTNNPFTGAAPAAMGVNTTATGNQQNTLGTQQIRPGMGNAVGTGGGPPRR